MKNRLQKLTVFLMALTISFATLPTTGNASSTDYAVVEANHLKFNGKNYFRVGSEDTYFAAYGEKKSPVFQGNYLETQDGLPAPKLKIREAVEVKIDFSKTSEKDFLANINAAVIFKGSVNTAYNDMKSGKLKLVKLVSDNEDIRSAINNSPKHLDNLRRYGNDARVVHQVFVVMDAKLTKIFTSATTFSIGVNAGVLGVTVEGGGGASGTTTISVSNGSIFAYGLVKLDWDKDKKKIEKVTDDQWGPV